MEDAYSYPLNADVHIGGLHNLSAKGRTVMHVLNCPFSISLRVLGPRHHIQSQIRLVTPDVRSPRQTFHFISFIVSLFHLLPLQSSSKESMQAIEEGKRRRGRHTERCGLTTIKDCDGE